MEELSGGFDGFISRKFDETGAVRESYELGEDVPDQGPQHKRRAVVTVVPPIEIKCLYCKTALAFVVRRGWVHLGGGTVKVECRACGYIGSPHPAPTACPRCEKATHLRDLHVATPDHRYEGTPSVPRRFFLNGELAE